MSINFRQIEVFLVVARTLSFSQAASICHLSQPALSATIKRLEETLGVRLFERTTRQVGLTEVGLEFHRMAEQIAEQVELAQTRIQQYANGKRGRLTIAAGPSIAASFIPKVIQQFVPRLPDVDIRIHDELSDICLEMVRARKADIAFTPVDSKDADLVSLELFRDYLVVIFPEGHALAAKKSLRWSDIQRHPQVAVNKRSHMRQTIEDQYLQTGEQFSPAYEVAQVATMLGLIGAGLGVGVLSESFLERINMTGLAYRRISSRTAYRGIYATVLASSIPSPLLVEFQEACVRVAAEKK